MFPSSSFLHLSKGWFNSWNNFTDGRNPDRTAQDVANVISKVFCLPIMLFTLTYHPVDCGWRLPSQLLYDDLMKKRAVIF
jgi:hypothetical protein